MGATASEGIQPSGAVTAQEEIGQRIGLERDMQAALRIGIEQLEPGLTIIDDGAERSVDAGFIDITARDNSRITVVIELKAGVAGQRAIAQILSYMGDVASEEKAGEYGESLSLPISTPRRKRQRGSCPLSSSASIASGLLSRMGTPSLTPTGWRLFGKRALPPNAPRRSLHTPAAPNRKLLHAKAVSKEGSSWP